MIKIQSVKVRIENDDMPDTSHMGDYTDEKTEWAICKHCGQYIHDVERYNRVVELIEEAQNSIAYETECRPNAALDKIYDLMTIARQKFEAKEHDCPKSHREYNYFLPYAGGETPGTENYKVYGLQDFKRMESMNNGYWHYVGLIAEVVLEDEKGFTKKLEASLWGVESDQPDYHAEVAKDLLAELKGQLDNDENGIDTSDFPESVEIESEY